MQQERRRYVRVQDQVLFRYRVLSQNEAEFMSESSVDNNSLLNKVWELENKFQALLPQLKNKSVEILEALRLLNEKITVLAEHAMYPSLDERYATCTMNVSACGAGFFSDKPLRDGTYLLADMVLQSLHMHIELVAIVVGCDPMTDEGSEKPYYVRLDFYKIKENQQERLIQYMVKRESQLLRDKRLSRELKGR